MKLDIFTREEISSILDTLESAVDEKAEAEMNAAACQTRSDYRRASAARDRAEAAKEYALRAIVATVEGRQAPSLEEVTQELFGEEED